MELIEGRIVLTVVSDSTTHSTDSTVPQKTPFGLGHPVGFQQAVVIGKANDLTRGLLDGQAA